jgi:hypothetical protein
VGCSCSWGDMVRRLRGGLLYPLERRAPGLSFGNYTTPAAGSAWVVTEEDSATEVRSAASNLPILRFPLCVEVCRGRTAYRVVRTQLVCLVSGVH